MSDSTLIPAAAIPADPIKVQPDDILNETRTNGANALVSAPPTFTQKAGMRLAAGVGIVGGLIIFLIVGDWMLHRPALPILPADPEKASQIIKNYKDLVDAYNTRSIAFYDAVVTKTLLPVFTAILGYIFGAKSADNAAAKNAD